MSGLRHKIYKNVVAAVTANSIDGVKEIMQQPIDVPYNMRKRKETWEESARKRRNFTQEIKGKEIFSENIFHIAASYDNVEMIDYLAGIYPANILEALNPERMYSPICYATKKETIIKLITLGANINHTTYYKKVGFKESPLYRAIQYQDFNKILLLLQLGANPCIRDDFNGFFLIDHLKLEYKNYVEAARTGLSPYGSALFVHVMRGGNIKINNDPQRLDKLLDIISIIEKHTGSWIAKQLGIVFGGYFAAIPHDIIIHNTPFIQNNKVINHIIPWTPNLYYY